MKTGFRKLLKNEYLKIPNKIGKKMKTTLCAGSHVDQMLNQFLFITSRSSEVKESIQKVLSCSESMDPAYTIDTLRRLPHIDKVSGNSTLARHFDAVRMKRRQLAVTGTETVIRADSVKKALIVCYREGREDWQKQCDDAKGLLEVTLGFVVCLKLQNLCHNGV